MVRGEDSTLRVFHNVCRHRGHILVSEPGALGKTSDVRITHGHMTWRAASSARRISAVMVFTKLKFDRSGYGLNEIATAIWK